MFIVTGCFSHPKNKGVGKEAFAYHGCTLWNDILTNIKIRSRYQNVKIDVKLLDLL